MCEKKARSSNFSIEEEAFLVDLVEKRIKVIENKKTDAASSDFKKKAWIDITTEFESKFDIKRGPKALREKYDNMKKKVKKHWIEDKGIRLSSGGPYKRKSEEILDRVACLMGFAPMKFSNFSDSESLPEMFSIKEETIPTQTELDDPLVFSIKGGKGAEMEMEEETVMDVFVEAAKKVQNDLSQYNGIKMKRKKSETFSSLIDARIKYLENEDRRSEERHEWERQQAELKTEILKLELQMKKKELEKNSN